jgi:hypothetical protein
MVKRRSLRSRERAKIIVECVILLDDDDYVVNPVFEVRS